MKELLKAFRRFSARVRGRPIPCETVVCEDVPERFARETIYLVGEPPDFWAAAMACPCGCGDAIHLSLLRRSRPRWRAREHRDGSVSLHPSVWRREGCESHFFIHHGVVRWCRPNTRGRWFHRWAP